VALLLKIDGVKNKLVQSGDVTRTSEQGDQNAFFGDCCGGADNSGGDNHQNPPGWAERRKERPLAAQQLLLLNV